MTKTISLLSLPVVVIGLSAAVGQAEAAERGVQHVASSYSAANDNSRTTSIAPAASRRHSNSSENPVTVRPYGSHNDGYRTSQGWWKDD